MVMADIEIDKDHTLTMYCEQEQVEAVPAALARVATVSLLSDARIDDIAHNVLKSMPNGISGFAATWGWYQFARALLEACAGYVREEGAKQ
jgi:hypothetical protein